MTTGSPSPILPLPAPTFPRLSPDPPGGLESPHLQAPARNGLYPPAGNRCPDRLGKAAVGVWRSRVLFCSSVGKSPGQKKMGSPFRATPGYGWAGFMTYAPNIKQVAGGRQWYESTGSNSLCQAGKADSDEEARWQPRPRRLRARIAGVIPELAGVLAGRANPRDGSPYGVILPALTNLGTGHKIRHWVFPSPRRYLLTMDMQNDIGETAGKVWQALSDEGPHTVVQLKKKLKAPNELLFFALGWLAREDKVEIVSAQKSFRVQLR